MSIVKSPFYAIGLTRAIAFAASVAALQVVPITVASHYRLNLNKNIIMGSTISPLSSTAKSSDTTTREEQKDAKFWNRIADKYSKQPIADEVSYQKKLDMTREYLSPSSKVLEFGCGTGSTAIAHAPFVKHIDAIDVSDKMIDIAKQKAVHHNIQNVHFETVGIDRLNVPDESYDVVLGLSVLHLVPNTNNVLNKVHRMLKPNGIFVSSTPCVGGGFLKYVLPIGSFVGLFPKKINMFTATELKESLTKAGFDIQREFQPSKDAALFLIAQKKKE